MQRQIAILAALPAFVLTGSLLMAHFRPARRPVVPVMPKAAEEETHTAQLSNPAPNSAPATAGKVDWIEMPFIGKLRVVAEHSTFSWRNTAGRTVYLPFTVYYTESGVWVRAVHFGPGSFPETTVEELQEWRYSNFEEIVGVPKEAPSEDLMLEILTNVATSVEPETAARIIIDYTMCTPNSKDPPQPILEVKLYGVEVQPPLVEDRRKVRYRYLLHNLAFAMVDQEL